MWLMSMEGHSLPVACSPVSPVWELFAAPAERLDIVATLRKELEQERACNAHLALELAEERMKVAELEAITGQIVIFQSPEPQNSAPELSIGAYPAKVRREKIEKYKRKLVQHRAKMQVSRTFPGRSGVARQKPRMNGRFVKQETPS